MQDKRDGKKKKSPFFRVDLLLILILVIIAVCFVVYMANTSLEDVLK